MTPERLRELYGEPSARPANKEIAQFDHHCKSFIHHSTFVLLATSDGENLDVSPKGDPAGFVEIESDTELLIPDRLGNNRIDGLMNIVKNPNVALLFMIPTVTETLRVNGVAEILDSPDICDRFKVRNRPPKTVLRIHAQQIFTHCGKAPIRAGLWKPESWPLSRPVATLFEMIRDHTALPAESLGQDAVDEEYEKTLY